MKRYKDGYTHTTSDGQIFFARLERDPESDWFGWWVWDRAEWLETPQGLELVPLYTGDYFPTRTLGEIRVALARM